MSVFFIYSHDGGPQEASELEFAANLSVPRVQLRRRVNTGNGQASFVSELLAGKTRLNAEDWSAVKREEEWPPATSDACMWVWWRYADQGIPDVGAEAADEVWTLTGVGNIAQARPAGSDFRTRARGET